MGFKKAFRSVGRALRVPTGAQAAGITTPRKAEGQMAEAARVAQQQAAAAAAQIAEYNQRLAEQAQKIREQQESAERTQAMQPPEAQAIGAANQEKEQRKRRMGTSRGSLLAGNTGGYNPATGGGRLGGMMRSLLG